MAWPFKEVLFDLLGGNNQLDNAADIIQTQRQPGIGTLDPAIPIRMPTATDVWSPNDRTDLATRPGFSVVRATAINAAGTVTGMIDQGSIAANFLLVVSIAAGTHVPYQDSANPPAALAGGTAFTTDPDNLASMANFTDGTTRGTIICTRQRDVVGFVSGVPAWSDLTIAGTGLTSLKPAICEVFGQRMHYADIDFDGTLYKNRDYYTDIRDGNLITDPTTQYESFERGSEDDQIRGMRRISDFMIVGGRDFIEFMALNTIGSNPFRRQEVPGGVGKGPMSHQGMVSAQQRVVWPAMTGIYSLEGSQGEVLREWTAPIKPFWTGLEQSRMQYICAGYDPASDIGCFAVTTSGGSVHDRVVAVNFKRGENYIWTLNRNAFANRVVSGQQRLIGADRIGLFYNEVQTTVYTGSTNDATTAIAADIITPLHHCGSPNIKKLFAGIKVWFVNQSTSEVVTVQWRTDTNNSFAAFSASPYTVTSSDKPKFFPLMKAGVGLQIEFKDVNSGQAMRVAKYSIMYRLLEPALI